LVGCSAGFGGGRGSGDGVWRCEGCEIVYGNDTYN
jgi:hypothetical protein